MADADLTYDFHEIPTFVRELDNGAQLVIGNRMQDIQPGAMPLLSRLGNPDALGFLNVAPPNERPRCALRDAGPAARSSCRSLNLRTVGMEFASEMVIRATREHLDVREIPIELHPRVGESKLSPFRDGWRHLRLILVYNPNFLFIVPGAVMFARRHRHRAARLPRGPALRPGPASPLADLRLPARPPRRPGDRARPLRARVRRLLHRRAGPLFLRLRARLRLEHGLALALLVRLAGVALFGIVFGKWAAEASATLRRSKPPFSPPRHRGRSADLLHVVPGLDHRAARRGTTVAAADMSADLDFRVGARSRVALLRGMVRVRELGVVLFVVALAVFALQSVVMPAFPVATCAAYLQTFLQLGYHEPVLTSVATRAGRSPRLASASRSSWAVGPRRFGSRCSIAFSIVAWSAVSP